MSTKANINKLFKLQKRNIRYVVGAKYNSQTKAIFKDLNLLKLNDMIELELAKFSFNFRLKKLPLSVMNLFKSNLEIHNYETRQKRDLRTGKHKTQLYNKSFLCECSKVWSALSMNIQTSENINTFVSQFKASLFQE